MSRRPPPRDSGQPEVRRLLQPTWRDFVALALIGGMVLPVLPGILRIGCAVALVVLLVWSIATGVRKYRALPDEPPEPEE